jgi:hypothetical protein
VIVTDYDDLKLRESARSAGACGRWLKMICSPSAWRSPARRHGESENRVWPEGDANTKGENMKRSTPTIARLALLILGFQAMIPLPVTLAWDAGTKGYRNCDRDCEKKGAENAISIIDTRPYWAKSTELTNSGRVADCPAGYTNTGLTCYRGPSTISNPSILANCPAGYTHTGLTCYRGPDTYTKPCTTIFKKHGCKAGYTDTGCFCTRAASSLSIGSMVCPAGYTKGIAGRCYKACPSGYTNTGEFCGRGADSLGMSSMTCAKGEVRIELSGGSIPRCYKSPVCPAGYEYWGFRCYITAPGVTRTAVSTVKMDVKQSGNTHLWIVNRALELLAKFDDPGVRNFVATMNQPSIREEWENGLWDADDSTYADYPDNMGTHFYNAAGKDWMGDATSVVTYDIVEGSVIPIVSGILGAPAANVAASKLIFKNKSSCKNARECANAQLAKLNGGLNTSNAYALGLALHYMTDMTQPMHASGYDGFKIPNNLHPQYEYYAAFVQGNWPTTNMTWDKRWVGPDPDAVFVQSSLKSNGFAPRLLKALHISGDAGIVFIPEFNDIGPYTGFNFYNDPTVDALTGEILRDAYQSTASYLYSVYIKIQTIR